MPAAPIPTITSTLRLFFSDLLVGALVGTTVEDGVSSFVLFVGIPDGKEVGIPDGEEVGIPDGEEVGIPDGKEVGILDGKEVGILDGEEVGIPDGEEVGTEVGISSGAFDEFKQMAHMLFRVSLFQSALNFMISPFERGMLGNCILLK